MRNKVVINVDDMPKRHHQIAERNGLTALDMLFLIILMNEVNYQRENNP